MNAAATLDTPVTAHVHALNVAVLLGSPATVVDLVHELDSHMDEEFPNSCPLFDEDEGEEQDWIRLGAMASPEYANNNCYGATHAVDELIVTQVGQEPGVGYGTVELEWETGVHWANTLTCDRTAWVVDYTARQFNPALPFPYVAPLASWKDVIDGYVAAQYGAPASQTHLH
ncbi:hypothetical protein [Tessaracoccus sp.]